MYFSKIYCAFIFGLILLTKVSVTEGENVKFRGNEFDNDDQTTLLKLMVQVGKVILSGNVVVAEKNVSSTELNNTQNERTVYDMLSAMNISFNEKLEEIRKDFKDRERMWEASLENIQKVLKDKEEIWKLYSDALTKKLDTDFKAIEDKQEKLSVEIEDLKKMTNSQNYPGAKKNNSVSGYIRIPGISASYKLYTSYKTLDEAKKACIEDGAHLPNVDSKELEMFLARMIEVRGMDKAWIGRVPVKIKKFRMNGQELDYLQFIKFYLQGPRPSANECIVLKRETGTFDWLCSDRFAYICEM